ncbi:hypothetical protein CFIMG_007457RA00001 [Ceratocystis fimbriata CBS 114723]|uniref:DUF3752 domain-containing protein n=1 Tax=Ceratocystis fimbriata CBS 114723 TaxID=1035309 RepID=A0A2C5WVL9_9PEZI|nr:hypothetical protein CFIMG_007457RA00001 [Ceratocystis fimbriata CBS 114723]
MSSIGPQLPSHLAKRKRGSIDSCDLPPSKTTASTSTCNKDEIALDDNDDDAYGPQVLGENRKSLPKVSIGSTVIPSPSSLANNEISHDSNSGSDTNKASQPPQAQGPILPSNYSTRVLGPSLPPTTINGQARDNLDPLTDTPITSELQPDPDSDSSSDDDYGPALPTEAQKNVCTNTAINRQDAQASSAPKRDEWMLAPPTMSNTRASDPTKIKNRTFASGRGASAASKNVDMSSIWTETPEEKRRRLENAVLGRADESEPKQARYVRSTIEEEAEQERRRNISEYTEQTRGKSLYVARQESLKSKTGGAYAEEDDPSKRAFDIQKDMAIGGRLDRGQKKQMLDKAGNFGDRFQKGSFL